MDNVNDWVVPTEDADDWVVPPEPPAPTRGRVANPGLAAVRAMQSQLGPLPGGHDATPAPQPLDFERNRPRVDVPAERSQPAGPRQMTAGEQRYVDAGTVERAGDQLVSGVETLRQGFLTVPMVQAFGRLRELDEVEAAPDFRALAPRSQRLAGPDMAEERARQRAAAEARLGEVLGGLIASQGRQENLAANPRARALVEAGNAGRWSEVWGLLRDDPAGIIQQFAVESLPNAAVSIVPGLAGAALGGRGVAAVAGGVGGYASEVGPRMVEGLTEFMGRMGVDTRDQAAVRAWMAANPQLVARAAQEAGRGALGPAIADALTMGLALGIRPGAGVIANTGRVGTNVVAGTGVEMAGEGLGQVLARGEIDKPGEILAEGLGALPQTIGGTAAGTIADLRQRPAAPPVVPGSPPAAVPSGAGTPPSPPSAAPLPGSSPQPGAPEGAAAPLPAGSPAAEGLEPAAGPAGAGAAAPSAAGAPAVATPPGVSAPPPAAPPPRPNAGRASLEAVLDAPDPAVVAAQRAATMQRWQAALPPGFTVVDDGDFFAVLDPIGQDIAASDNPSDETIADSVADIQQRLQQGMYPDLTREGDGTRAAPVVVRDPSDVDAAGQQAQQPTPAQAAAGNYQHGHLRLHGMDMAIETPRGGTRSGVGADGTPWSVQMPAAYGRIKGARGADGDQLDVYLGPAANDPAMPVWVIDQVDPDTGRFDEHKVMVGWPGPGEARATYDQAFNDGRGPERRAAITRMTLDEFRAWMAQGDLRMPASKTGVAEHKRRLQAFREQQAAAEKAQQEAAAQPRPGKVGDSLAAGEVVLTSTGRPTTAFPKIDAGSDRKAQNTVRRVAQWLMDNAIAEAEARGDEFNARMFRQNRDAPSQADKDSAEAYLFDPDFQFPVPAPFTRPIGASAAPPTSPAPTTPIIEQEPEPDAPASPPTGEGAPNQAPAPEGDEPRAPTGEEGVATAPTGRGGKKSRQPEAPPEPEAVRLAKAFGSHFRGGRGFKTIQQARAFAQERLGRPIVPGTADAKMVDEAVEAGVVWAARAAAVSFQEDMGRPGYNWMVGLYERQPPLNVRTSDSIERQAYSTPAPLAFLASQLAGVRFRDNTTVLEPTAGNGMLLIGADYRLARVNELDPARAESLRQHGATVTTEDASAPGVFEGRSVDVVLANPPFGAVKDADGRTRRYDLSFIQPGYETGEVDHAIALRALEAMKDDGRAVLILGGVAKTVVDPEKRADAYHSSKAKREFFLTLYRNYRVTDHFTVAGELYARQGASWPVDVIVIEGRGRSDRKLPAQEAPRIYSDWDSLGGLLNGRDDGRVAAAGQSADGMGAAGDQPGVVGGASGPGGSAVGNDGPGVSGGPGDARGVDGGAGTEPGGSGARPDAGTREPGPVGNGRPRGGRRGAGGSAADPEPGVAGLPQPSDRTAGAAADGPVGDDGRAGGEGDDNRGVDQPSVSAGDGPDLDGLFDEVLNEEFGAPPAAPAPSGTQSTARPTTAAVAASAAANSAKSLAEVGKALESILLPKGGKISSNPIFDPDTYAQVLPHLRRAAELARAAWADIKELAARVKEMIRAVVRGITEGVSADNRRAFADQLRPYITRFASEVQDGKVTLDDATEQQTAPNNRGGSTEPPPAAPRERKPRQQDEETDRQVAYKPKADADGVGTLVPVNMQTAITRALDAAEKRAGKPLVDWVAERLGYTPDEVRNYFSAEQIDALALGITNLDSDAGFVIGDQTGVGKGRFVAAMIRYALSKGLVPVFVTEKPNLYADMARDLTDIGMPSALDQILPTNSSLNLALTDEKDGSRLKTGDAKAMSEQLTALSADQAIADRRIVFTTYSQMQQIAQADTARIRFLRAIAPKAFIILDESHNAGGAGQPSDDKTQDRGTIFRNFLRAARAAVYSSATWAKRPDVMDLYGIKTDMRLAVPNLSKLAEAIQKGGVPMQQIVSAMLAESGQYIRRERSFAGVSYDLEAIPVDRETYDSVASSLARIFQISTIVGKIAKARDKEAKADAKKITADGSAGSASVESANFGAVMHNLINQMLLASKAPGTARLALDRLKAGEKPVIAVANTMGSFIEEYASEVGAAPGDRLNLTFNQLLLRYLQKSMILTVKRPFMKKGEKAQKIQLTPDDLGPEGKAAYDQAKRLIESLDLSAFPLSPIDYIRAELNKAGYRVGEITGRTEAADYRGDGVYYRRRPQKETTPAGRQDAIRRFNGGSARSPLADGERIDVMILNQSGATGLSLHASEKFGDRRKRVMLIAQAEANIDTHMQMLGRVHRTGQIIAPAYLQLVADVPAEKRPAAVLAKKMASLAAATTANRRGALAADESPDFLNEYGDQVVAEFVENDAELWKALGKPQLRDADDNPEDAARRVSGRIPLLPLKKQEEVYADIEALYRRAVEIADEQGTNRLEAKTLDLDAKLVEEKPWTDGSGDRLFAGPSTIGLYDVKKQSVPLAPSTILLRIADALGEKFKADEVKGFRVKEVAEAIDRLAATRSADDWQDGLVARIDDAHQAMVAEIRSRGLKPDALTKAMDRVDGQRARLRAILDVAQPGRFVQLQYGDTVMNGRLLVLSVSPPSKGNILAPGSWEMVALNEDGTRWVSSLAGVFTQDNRPQSGDTAGKALAVTLRTLDRRGGYEGPTDVTSFLETVEAAAKEAREKRWIVTGNLLAGFARRAGQIANFYTADGDLRQGVVMPSSFDLDEFEKEQLPTFDWEQAARFLADGAISMPMVQTSDEKVRIARADNGTWVISTPASKSEGADWFLDPTLRQHVIGEGFVGRTGGQEMRAVIKPGRLQDAMRALGRINVVKRLNFISKTDGAKEWIQRAKADEINASAPDVPAVAQLSGQEIVAPTTAERRRVARDWMYENLRGRTIYSKALGAQVRVNRRGIEKTLSGAVGDRILDGVPGIAEIIESGALVSSEPPRVSDGATSVRAYHRLAAQIRVGTETRTYRVLIREDVNGQFYYRLEAERAEIETPDASAPTDLLERAGEGTDASGAVLNLEEAPGEIKPLARWGAVGDMPRLDPIDPAALRALLDVLRTIAGPEAVLELSRDGLGRSNGVALGPLVRLAYSIGRTNAQGVVRHEAIHVLRNLGKITDAEWAILTEAAEREGWAERFNIEGRYRAKYGAEERAGSPRTADERMQEEAVADAYRAWATGNMPQPSGPVARIFQKIRQFLNRLRNAMQGRGFADVESIFQRIERGDMGARAPGARRRSTTSAAAARARMDARFGGDGVINADLPAGDMPVWVGDRDDAFAAELRRAMEGDGEMSLSLPERGVLDRIPELEEAAQGVRDGTVTPARYAELVRQFKPVTPYASVPAPASPADMRRGLKADQQDRIGVPSSKLAEGAPVGLRLDIPAYAKHGVWVVSVHEQEAGFAAGTSIGYEPVAAATNVTLGVVEKAALKIAAGNNKATIAVMKGAWSPITPEQAKRRADAAMSDPAWVQVGMDPTRHAYFYDRVTMQPVVAADEVIQIGPLVLAKNPTYGLEDDFMFSLPGDVRRAAKKAAKAVREENIGVVRRLWRGAPLPEGVDVKERVEQRDLGTIKRWLGTPEMAFKKWPQLARLVQAGIRAEENQSVWINRLVEQYERNRTALSKAGGDWAKVQEALWSADAQEVDIENPTQAAAWFAEHGLSEAEAKAAAQTNALLVKQARLVDQHRRAMIPKVREQKALIWQRMQEVLRSKSVPTEEYAKLYRRRAYLNGKIRENRGDIGAHALEVKRINERLRAIRLDDPDVQALMTKLQDKYDELEARLAATSVRRRAGYVPHKFYGSWRLFRELGTDAEGNAIREEITSDQGFYDSRGEAIAAAERFLEENPGASLTVEPKLVVFPGDPGGATVTDAAYSRLKRGLEAAAADAGITVDGIAALKGVAKRRSRRRVYSPSLFRQGAEGYARDLDKVMRTHIGQTVRYVAMDRLKFDYVETTERLGLSPYRMTSIKLEGRANLQAALEAWWRDVNGAKQNHEAQIDQSLQRMGLPRATLTALLPGAFVAATGAPVVGTALAGYLGFRMYRAMTKGGEFPFRTMVQGITSDMAHLKLGMVVNIGSALVNLSQTALNTLPVLGPKWTAIGMQRAAAALYSQARNADTPGRMSPDAHLLTRADIRTRFRHSEDNPLLAEAESRARKISMWAFEGAERMNRATAFLGAIAKAEAEGASPAAAMEQAKAAMRRTQFHGGQANRPEVIRQRILQAPLQFKNYLLQQLAFFFGLEAKQMAVFMLTMVLLAGLLAFPGFQLLDWLFEAIFKFSVIDAAAEVVADAQMMGDLYGGVAQALARGLPALLGFDITQRIGMGAGFLPDQGSDFYGPFLSTITQLQQLERQSAQMTDMLLAVTPGAMPLKVLEAAANGASITSPAFWSGGVFGDGDAAWTNPRKRGNEEVEPTTRELLTRAAGLQPVRWSERQALERRQLDRVRDRRKDENDYLAEIIQARRNGRPERITEILAEARRDGVNLTQRRVVEAIRSSEMSRGERAVRQAPRQDRGELQDRLRAIDERAGVSR